MPKSKFMLVVTLLLVISPTFAQQQMPAKVVRVAEVSRTELAPTVAVPGTIYSRNEVQITAGVSGQLQMVAEPGTVVEKGQAVARIDKSTLRLQRAEQEVLLERDVFNIRHLNIHFSIKI